MIRIILDSYQGPRLSPSKYGTVHNNYLKLVLLGLVSWNLKESSKNKNENRKRKEVKNKNRE